MTLRFFLLATTLAKAMREASSMATWTNSQTRPLAARSPVPLSAANAVDAMADTVNPTELFDVKMDYLARGSRWWRRTSAHGSKNS